LLRRGGGPSAPIANPSYNGLTLWLERLTMVVLLLVVAAVAWMVCVAAQPDWLRLGSVEMEAVIVLGLLTAALVLVSVAPRRDRHMADRSPAIVWIGGAIPKALVPSLCQVLTAQGVCHDWDEPVELASQADLESALNEEGRLQFTDPEARYGAFQELEAFLEGHGISYDRHASAMYEYDAELVRYRGGLSEGGKLVQPALECGEPVVPVAEVEKARQLLLTGDVAAAVGPPRKCEVPASRLAHVLDQRQALHRSLAFAARWL
jgi:hypothetical protein